MSGISRIFGIIMGGAIVEKVPNIQWALDFMHDSLYCGKRFRTLNIIDEGTRECLAIEVDTS